MSKRWPGLLLSLCLLIGCFGCGRQMAADQPKSPMKFYYKTVDARYGEGQGATGYELREVYGHESDYVWILTEYLQGPVSQELVAPFQRSVSVVSAERVGTQLQLCMSEELANLSGVDLTLACACITWTCLECSGVESVSIRAVGRQLDGKEEIVLNRTHFLMEDSSANLVNAPYTLYFSDTDNRYLIGEEITVGREQEDLPVFLVRQLIGGPTEPGLAETMPLGTTLLGLSVTEGICAVDLSGEFLTNAPQTALAQRMTILSLTNTLTQLDDVDSVVLYAEGQPLTQYGMMDLSQPLTYEEGAIGPVRKSLNEFDADLVPGGGRQRLVVSGSCAHSPDRERDAAGAGCAGAFGLYQPERLPERDPGRYHLAFSTPGGHTVCGGFIRRIFKRRKGHIVPCGSFRCGDGVRTGRWHGCTDHRRGGHTGRGCRRLVLGASVERFLVLLIMEAGNRQRRMRHGARGAV